ncbi:MAG: hypothetical protein WDZ91_03055 [Paenibacillaceae bacterium]
MIDRALTLAGNQAGSAVQQGEPAGQADQLLAKFADHTSISSWAQAAVMLKRFLQYVRFIDYELETRLGGMFVSRVFTIEYIKILLLTCCVVLIHVFF